MADHASGTGLHGWSAALDGIHWRPDKDTAVAIATYLLVVALFIVAFQVFTTERVAANFLTFSVALAVGGIAIPVAYRCSSGGEGSTNWE